MLLLLFFVFARRAGWGAGRGQLSIEEKRLP
jgi:hypothetical protein